MAGNYCHLCKLATKEFVQLAKYEEPWVHEELKLQGNEFVSLLEIKPKAKPQNGVKTTTWWPFIPMNHFIVPLIQCLIGVRDNILTKFRNLINEYVEYLSPVEVDTRLDVGAMNLKQGNKLVTLQLQLLMHPRLSIFCQLDKLFCSKFAQMAIIASHTLLPKNHAIVG